MSSRSRSVLMGVVLALAPAPAFAAEGDAACVTDLAAVDKSFRETIARLEAAGNAPRGEKCAALRHHIDVMTRGREVFQRCLSGLPQRENVGQMNDSIQDFEGIVLLQRCR